MKNFPWLLFIVVMIPITLVIWRLQHRRWQPRIDALNAEIGRVREAIERDSAHRS